MRSLTLQSDNKKKGKGKKLLVGGILIGVMFFSVLGYSFLGDTQNQTTGNNPNVLEYNGFQFIKQDSYWFTGDGYLNFIFSYNPGEVPQITTHVNPLSNYNGKPLYVYSETKEAELEVYRNFEPSINPVVLRIQSACFSEEDCIDKDSPIKGCEYNFIIIKENNETSITQDDNCVFITGPLENLTQITDEFLFKVFGIA